MRIVGCVAGLSLRTARFSVDTMTSDSTFCRMVSMLENAAWCKTCKQSEWSFPIPKFHTRATVCHKGWLSGELLRLFMRQPPVLLRELPSAKWNQHFRHVQEMRRWKGGDVLYDFISGTCMAVCTLSWVPFIHGKIGYSCHLCRYNKKNTNKVATLFPSVLLLNRAFLCYSEVIWRRKRNVTLQKRFAEKRWRQKYCEKWR